MLAFIVAAVALGMGMAAAMAAGGAVDYPAVTLGHHWEFPRDYGAHPAYRTEWWYITGWVADIGGVERGIQVTFFRSRPGLQEDSASAFAPKQLVFAHAAIADAAIGSLLHAQRAARAGFGLVFARSGDTDVRIDDWTLTRSAGSYQARIVAGEFALTLDFAPTQPPLLQGDDGFSRKGPMPAQASYYVSEPQLAVSGELAIRGERLTVRGTAWLDHEWSSQYLSPQASGWDWTGINFDDGAALMAFRIRSRDGGVLWAGGTYRDARGKRTAFGRGDIDFSALERWRSPRTGARYPVAMRVRAGEHTIELAPLLEDQELDARASTGTVYWEGAVRALRDGKRVGRGYLELTGYLDRLDL